MNRASSLTTCLALLRGINVVGKNAIRMAELQALCASLSLQEVRTYLQSGNIVFKTSRPDTARLASAIQTRVAQDFGHDVPILVMSAQALDAVANSNSLGPKKGADETLFHCTFLFQPVPEREFRALKLPTLEGEAAALAGTVVLLHCPHGYGKTKLNNSYFERALGVTATTRNWRTVLALQQLCHAS